ncbi:RNA polymerase sporulation sigma factor SigH [Alkalibacter saccharofermentans]|uniref:RNA polymerase sigma factor SigS n=1 Tax=Alkalibacter saccharofermentans DSM 14828 TaxID=1120975 RepID=A0A1M4YQL4_9FIRM|nr:RNA polymerase sporulation sigma factor SigH [Alkalibacter saccharofermentans]SHF07626.1 RNA polymerase sporulation-specific sigma factor [Alkalibacter saccharofermentans DSM 14828]
MSHEESVYETVLEISDGASDEKLVEIAQKGDKKAMSVLALRYKKMVGIKARSYYLAGGDKDDLVQEGMIGLCKAVKDYKADRQASFKVFADLCVQRQLIGAIKKANRHKHAPLNSYVSFDYPVFDGENGAVLGDVLRMSKVSEPETVVLGNEEILDVELIINERLSNFERKVLKLYLEGKNYLEMSEQLKKEHKSIDNALQRIRKKIDTLRDTKY